MVCCGCRWWRVRDVIVSLSSAHGSPGVTSWAVLLGAALSGVERVVLEADADGGVLAARFGLGVDPGVATLLAVARRHDDRNRWFEVSTVARRLGERLWVIPSAESAERVVPVWGSSADDVARVAARDDRVWLVDCGRLSPSSFALPFAARSALTIVVCGPHQEDLVAVPARIAGLQRAGAETAGVLVVGRARYGADELTDFFGTGLVWQVRASDDLVSLAGLVLTSRRARRSWVWREAVGVAADITARLVIEPVADPAGAAAELGEAAGE